MRYKEYEIKFELDRYGYDNSTFIGALIMEDNEPVDYYTDVTTCSMFTAFKGEVALDMNNAKELIDEMERQGLIEITPRIVIRSGFCEYPIGRLKKKFFDEVVGNKVEAYEMIFMK